MSLLEQLWCEPVANCAICSGPKPHLSNCALPSICQALIGTALSNYGQIDMFVAWHRPFVYYILPSLQSLKCTDAGAVA